nr:hypothetical protein [Mycoplasmopsis bovis]
MSSMPLIAASCENKNPTDESIINNIAPTSNKNLIDNLKRTRRYLMVLVILLQILTPKLKIIKIK